MTVLPLLAVSVLMNFVAVLFVLVCIILVLVVLVQKGRGGGLSGAFGGGMASGLLGSKTGDFLTWATIVVVTIFLTLAVIMARYYRPSIGAEFGAPVETTQPITPETTTEIPAPQSTTTETTPPAEQPGSASTGADTGSAVPAAQPPAGTGQGDVNSATQ